jgi:IS5 family transposase
MRSLLCAYFLTYR